MPTQSSATSSKQEQIAYFEQVHKSFIDFWAHICNLTRVNLSNPGNDPDVAAGTSTH